MAYELGSMLLAAGRIKLPENYKLSMIQVLDALAGNYYLPLNTGTRANVSEILADLGPLQGRDGPTLRFEDKIVGRLAGNALLNDKGYLLSKDLFAEIDRVLDLERRWAGEAPEKDSEKEPPTSDLGKLHWFLQDCADEEAKRRLAQLVKTSLKIAMEGEDGGMGSDLRHVYGSRYVQRNPASAARPR